MTRDTFDIFTDTAARGRFGDNEQRETHSRVTGASDLVDIDLVHHLDYSRDKSIKVSKDGKPDNCFFLPKSQVEIEPTGPINRRKSWYVIQPVKITMPLWLAKDKGLV